MKLRETLLATKANKAKGISDIEDIAEQADWIGDQHTATSVETPLRKDAFELSPEEKVDRIEEKMRDVLHILGLDLKDESLQGTPRRVAKMYVNEVFGGLLPENKPARWHCPVAGD